MAKHLESVSWHTRIGTSGPYQAVSTSSETSLRIGFFPGWGKDGIGVEISRKDAKLLARRIEQCLAGTTGRGKGK